MKRYLFRSHTEISPDHTQGSRSNATGWQKETASLGSDPGAPSEMTGLILTVMLAGFVLRFLYIVLTPITVNQNDVFAFMPDVTGHFSYILHIAQTLSLPDMDPAQALQFYHPPLHHIIAALWYKLNLGLGISSPMAAENLQLLPFFYSCATVYTVNRICLRLAVPDPGRLLCVSALSFTPYFVMTAGALNNDCLLTLLMTLALLAALKWYQEPSLKLALCTAVAIGLAGCTKTSGLLILPPVLLLMALKAAKAKQLRMALPLLPVCLISTLLGLWYQLRNYIRYDLPLTYVLKLPESSEQNIASFSPAQRFFDFSPEQWRPLTVVWSNTQPNCDHSIFISLVKFTTFNEYAPWYDMSASWVVRFAGVAMFTLVFVLLAATLVGFCYWVFKGRSELPVRLFLAAVWLVVMVMYFKFCLDYPFVCTMNVRYILAALIVQFTGGAAALPAEKLPLPPASAGAAVFTALYAAGSLLFFANYLVSC